MNVAVHLYPRLLNGPNHGSEVELLYVGEEAIEGDLAREELRGKGTFRPIERIRGIAVPRALHGGDFKGHGPLSSPQVVGDADGEAYPDVGSWHTDQLLELVDEGKSAAIDGDLAPKVAELNGCMSKIHGAPIMGQFGAAGKKKRAAAGTRRAAPGDPHVTMKRLIFFVVVISRAASRSRKRSILL